MCDENASFFSKYRLLIWFWTIHPCVVHFKRKWFCNGSFNQNVLIFQWNNRPII